MKNVIKISTCIAAVAVITIMACNKESVKDATSVATNPSIEVSSRDGQTSTDLAEGEAYKADIVLWKGKFDAWRAGTSSTETMEARAAVEKLESVFNYYLCDAAKSYNVDKTVQSFIEVPGSSLFWNTTKVASTLEAIKAKIVESFDALDGVDKGIRFIDLGTPTVSGSNLRFHIDINMGSGVVTEGETVVTSTSAVDTRWGNTANDDPNGQITCSGDAGQKIGIAVNKELGYFVGNLPIAFVPITNPNKKMGVVLSDIVNILTNKDAVPSPAISSLFVYNTLDLLDISADPNSPINDYPDKGKYKIHCDFPTNQPCFSEAKVKSYIKTNVEVAKTPKYIGSVRTSKPFPLRAFHNLVGTCVTAQKTILDVPGLPLSIETREHPTFHYYAKTTLIFDVVKRIPKKF